MMGYLMPAEGEEGVQGSVLILAVCPLQTRSEALMLHRNWNPRAFMLICTVFKNNNKKMAKLFVEAPKPRRAVGVEAKPSPLK